MMWFECLWCLLSLLLNGNGKVDCCCLVESMICVFGECCYEFLVEELLEVYE